MSGLLCILLFLAFRNSLCNPAIRKPQVQPPEAVYSSFFFPANELPEEIDDTNPLSIYKDNPWAKPAKFDNRRVAKFAQQLDDFHKRLTDTVLADKPGENVIYSPISISILLMTIAFGSRGRTLSEILGQSGLEFDTDTLLGFQELINIMKNINGVDLEFANIVFASKDVDILPDYQKEVAAYLKSEFKKINFYDTNSAAQQINDWCRKQTKNQITEIVNPDDLSNIVLMLSNAIYFKGDWMTPFDVADTRNNVPFYISKTKTVPVSMMHLKDKFNFGRINELNTRYIEMPYVHEKNSRDTFSMYLLVPVNHDGLELLEKKLHFIDFKRLDQMEEEVSINLPKFKIQSTLDIKPIFEKMGMKSMFTNRADFRGLLDHKTIHIDKIVQKASLTVDEKGSTAAVVSAAGLSDRIGSVVITVDRPFICAIVLKSLGLPVFYARIVDPTTSD